MDEDTINLTLNTFVEYSDDETLKFIRNNMSLLKELSVVLYESVINIDSTGEELIRVKGLKK